MKWVNTHLNWTYGIILIIAVIILALSLAVVLRDLQIASPVPVIGIVLYFLLTFGGSAWVLWKKGQSLWFLAVALIFMLALVILVFALPNNRTGQKEKSEISDDDYYRGREDGA